VIGRVRNRIAVLGETLCPGEVFLVLLLLTTGIIALAHWSEPDPLSLLLPHWVSIAWDIVLVTGGALALGGLVFVNWLVVRIGYTLLGPASAAYATALAPHATITPIRINVAVLFALALACLWRSLQITFTIRRSG
jgi:hypothetical protein